MVDVPPAAGSLTVTWDAEAETLVLVGTSVGPAGAARFDPLPGMTIEVDFAQPQVLSEVILEVPPVGLAPGGPLLRLVGALLGPAAAASLLSPPLARGAQRLGRRPMAGVGRMAVLHELLHEGVPTAIAHGVGLLEAATLAAGVAGFEALASGRAREGAAVLGGIASAPLGIGDPSLAREVADTCRRAAALVGADDGATVLQRLAQRLDPPERRLPQPVPAARVRFGSTSVPPGPTRRPGAAALTPSGPGEVAEVPVGRSPRGSGWSAELIGGSELEVRHPEAGLPALPGFPAPSPPVGADVAGPPLWARAFRRQGLVLLALSPVRRAAGGWSARLLIPPGLGPEQLLVDVTAEPQAPRSSVVLGAIRRALAAGRAACAAERRGDRSRAAAAWRRCSAAWVEAGDAQRAAEARAYAEGRAPAPAFLLDRLLDSLGGLD